MKACTHRKHTEMQYGFASASGWRGLGAIYRCPDCAKALWFEDDLSTNTDSEIGYNERKRRANLTWKDGEFNLEAFELEKAWREYEDRF